MNIKAGEKLIRYSEVFGIPIEEVVAWVNGYVNTPEESYAGKSYETSEELRLKSIGNYIDWRLANSSWAKVAMRKERKAA